MNIKTFAFAALLAAPAFADTITTDVGVTFDGVVSQNADGTYTITAGDHVLIYRKEEIVNIEKNDKTGKLDLEAVNEESRKADERLTKLTGLNLAQRARVDALLLDLLQDGPPRIKARDAILAMASECDVYKYLDFLYAEATPYTQAALIEVLFKLDAGRSVERLRASLESDHPMVRAKAIEVLGQAGDSKSGDNIARGLVDPDNSVRIAAAYALATLKLRAATPALIETLKHPDLRVSGAAKEALSQMWSDVVGDKRPSNVDEWNAVWSANQKGVGKPVILTDLSPLADPAKPFVAG